MLATAPTVAYALHMLPISVKLQLPGKDRVPVRVNDSCAAVNPAPLQALPCQIAHPSPVVCCRTLRTLLT